MYCRYTDTEDVVVPKGIKLLAQRVCVRLQAEIELSHNSIRKQKYNLQKLAGV